MTFLQALDNKFNKFYGDEKDLQILNNIKIINIIPCESKQRKKI